MRTLPLGESIVMLSNDCPFEIEIKRPASHPKSEKYSLSVHEYFSL